MKRLEVVFTGPCESVGELTDDIHGHIRLFGAKHTFDDCEVSYAITKSDITYRDYHHACLTFKGVAEK